MSKAPDGWVVQVTIPAVPKPPKEGDVRWIGASLQAAPTFRFFNVAIASADKAVEATSKHLAKTDPAEREMRAVRGLSTAEIAALKLKPGDLAPA
jgi:hypothetical protein